ncbi:MAG TPA: insulinase family protein, partial [Gemmatimonadaceae bacterium]|nr:insulinase family protein [Gemmatimonadaceae bacterium]
GRGSRLYRAVRERQLASSVSASNYTPTALGIFDLHLQSPPDRGREAAVSAWAELRDLADRGPAAAEVERVRRIQEARWLRRLETMEGQASFLAEWEALGDWRLSSTYFDRLMRLEPSDVHAAAARHLAADQVSLLVYRPRSVEPFAADVGEARALLSAVAARPASPTETAARSNGRRSVRPAVALERRTGLVSVFRMPNGLPILVRRRPGAPLVHLGVFSAAGAAVEPAHAAGVTMLMARAALKGTEERSAAEIAYASELLGGSISPSVTADSASWVLSVPAGRAAEAAELLGDVVQHPRFAAAAIDTERSIALSQLAQMRDDMLRHPIRLATAAAFGDHPYARTPLGADDTLAAATEDVVRAAHEQVLRRAPAVVAVVGDADEVELATLLARAFPDVANAPAIAMSRPIWPSEPVASVEPRDKAQTGLAVLFPGPDRRDTRRFVAHLAAGIASGLGGRFFEALREKRSLAYTVMAQASERAAAGLFLAYIATSPEREDEAREGLLQQFTLLREQEVTDEELTRAKVYAIGSRAIGLQSGAAVLGEMVDAWLHGAGLEELDEFVPRVRAVTAEQIRDLAREYFDPGRRAEGIVRGLAARPATAASATR